MTPSEIHKGHRSRMKKRFMNDTDFSSFSEHEILEMVLYYCYPRTDTNTLAHKLINYFGSLNGVLSADKQALMNSGIIGENPAESLVFFGSLSVYLRRAAVNRNIDASNIESVKEYISSCFISSNTEQVIVFPVNSLMKIFKSVPIVKGLIDETSFDITQIVKIVLSTDCKTLFIAHNHPNESSYPSQMDIITTRNLIQSLSTLGITLLDHFIVGNDGVLSLRSIGKIFDYE